MEICQRTVDSLLSVMENPDGFSECLDNAASDVASVEIEGSDFSDPRIGDRLCFSTCLAMAEQMYRYQREQELFGNLISGKMGEILSMMMVAAAKKHRRRRKNEDLKPHIRTSWGNVRNFWNDLEIIQETSMCILFGAVDYLRMLVPMEIGEVRKLKRKQKAFKAERHWQAFTAYSPNSGTVELATHISGPELKLLEKIVQHNQEHEMCQNNWQFCLFPTREAELVCDLFDRDILTVRRVYGALRGGIDSCIFASFGATVQRFLLLEYGHNTELPRLMRTPRGKASHNRVIVEFRDTYTHADAIPMELMEDLWNTHSTPLERAIIRVACEHPDANGRQSTYEVLNTQLAKPIGFRTFAGKWAAIMQTARKLGNE